MASSGRGSDAALPAVKLVGVEPVRGSLKLPSEKDDKREACGDPVLDDDEDPAAEELAKMVDPATGEWNGPTRGGTRPEPTRFGDWATKGRVTDF